MNGWSGRRAVIDLRTKTVEIQCPDRKAYYEQYIGGRGFVADELVKVAVGTTPLSEANPLIFAVGPLTGTNVPGSSRAVVGHLNVLSGGCSWANVGGGLGAALKCAGFDCIVLTGRATQPVYLLVADQAVTIKDARHLWGLDAVETAQAIRRELGTHQVSVAAIGPAGENLVRQACVVVDEGRAAGWGGCGAVMGSKKVKAVAVFYGRGAITVSDPNRFNDIVCRVWRRAYNSRMVARYRRYGTLGIAGVGGIESQMPQAWRNHQDEWWDANKYVRLKEVVFRERYERRRLSCFGCPIACSHLYVGPDMWCEGIQANTVRGFGSNLDVDEPQAVLYANALCNRMGLDVDGVSTALGWAMECYERGVLSKSEADGLELQWGNSVAVLALIVKVARRQGIGDLLAEGVAGAAMKLGRGSEEWALAVKGVGMNEQGVRSHKGWALGIVTSTRGGGHLCGAPNTEQTRLTSELGDQMFGVPTAGDPLTYKGKGTLVAWFDRFKALVDMMGFCYFVTWWGGDKDLIGPGDIAELYHAATGSQQGLEELNFLAERVINLEKALNTLFAGYGRKDDQPHLRFSKVKISRGPFQGESLEPGAWQAMLTDYYRAHKWDASTGWQPAALLRDFGLKELAERLGAHNRLPGSSLV